MKLFSKAGQTRHQEPVRRPAPRKSAQTPKKMSVGKAAAQTAAPARRGSGRGRIAGAVAAIAAALVIVVCVVLVVVAGRVTTVFPNVTLDGMEIGGMTDIELSELLFEKGYESVGDQAVTVELPLGYTLSIKAEEVCENATVADIVDGVMKACRGGSSLSAAKNYLQSIFGGMKLESGVGLSVDEKAVRAQVENMVGLVNRELKSSDITIGENSVKLVKGASSICVDAEELSRRIVDAFLQQNYDVIPYEAQVQEDREPDIEGLFRTISCEARNAAYDPATDSITPEVVGMSFDKEEARRIWSAAEYGEEVEIPLTLTEPDMTAEELEALLFRDCFCKKGTSLIGSSSNRINNVTKAAASINGMVLMPGEEFSYNEALGERTAENGYLTAGAYSGGQTVQEYGGGICQVSSTLYYCALYANLKITSRTCHMFPVGYLPAGLDATVSWGGPEFKFVNDREYPVKIVSYVEGNEVYVELWGTDVDGSYVEINYATSIVYDSKYTDVAIGYKATTYRSVYDKNGNLISKELEAKSTYNYHKEDIKWPEESPEVTGEPEPTDSPEVTPPDLTEEPIVTDAPPAFTGDPTVPPPVDPTEPVEPTEPVGGEADSGGEGFA